MNFEFPFFIDPLVLMFLYFLTVMVRGYFESISCDIALLLKRKLLNGNVFKRESVV
jgi:hypothetical protein